MKTTDCKWRVRHETKHDAEMARTPYKLSGAYSDMTAEPCEICKGYHLQRRSDDDEERGFPPVLRL